MSDLRVDDLGSIVLLTPLTGDAQRWVDANLSVEQRQWLGGALAVEPRCVDALLDAAVADGLEVDAA
jgi:hypothetical protein